MRRSSPPSPPQEGRKRQPRPNGFPAVSALILLWLVSGCGYRFVGTGDLPPGVTSVGIQAFQNRTTVVGVENTVTNDLVFEFTRAGRLPVVAPEDASVVMTGTIRTFRESSLSRTGTNTARERRATLSVEFVASRSDGEVLWQRVLSDSETYVVLPDNFGTQANRRVALEEVTRRLAEKAYYGITERF